MKRGAMEKHCPKCERTKSLSEFYRNKSRKDGLSSYCKDCEREYKSSPHMRAVAVRATTRYHQTARGREAHRIANQKYRGSRKAQRQKAKSTKRYQQNNPRKTKAHRAVNDAIRRGHLPPVHTQTCNECGAQAEHYHHEDYTRRLDVTPLCRQCHESKHQEEQCG